VREAQRRAWDTYRAEIDTDITAAKKFIEQLSGAFLLAAPFDISAGTSCGDIASVSARIASPR